MTNYNDGKWHGWNGGECPVHPLTEIEGVYIDPEANIIAKGSPLYDDAKHFDWNRDDSYILVAFRVIKEFKEPREFWLFWDDKEWKWCASDTREHAESKHEDDEAEIIHVREVQ